MHRTLVSWMGHNDLLGYAETLDEAERARFLASAGIHPRPARGPGPIRTLLDNVEFDEVHLISNDPERVQAPFGRWLRPTGALQIHSVRLTNPTDYRKVFETTDRVMSELVPRLDPQTRLAMHLSPGTPAMTAIWVLLGKTRYPAEFYQTHEGRAWIEQIPFDVFVDFLPRVLRDSDRAIDRFALARPSETEGFEHILGESRIIAEATTHARLVARRNVSVLLTGETGTGKELFARAIHNASSRRRGPFIVRNCAAIPRELFESEMFGHVRGAFTGAATDRTGAFAEANGGTLFLDEIAKCDREHQAKLLRVLEPLDPASPTQRAFRAVGASNDETCDVRIIAATKDDLFSGIEQGTFLEDLYYRIATFSLHVPALRERGSDVRLIARHILDELNRQNLEIGEPTRQLSAGANRRLSRHKWPGNVRELRIVLLRAAVLAGDAQISEADIDRAINAMPQPPTSVDTPVEIPDGFNLSETLRTMEREFLVHALERCRGRKVDAARLLGLKSPQALDSKLRQQGLYEQWSRRRKSST